MVVENFFDGAAYPFVEGSGEAVDHVFGYAPEHTSLFAVLATLLGIFNLFDLLEISCGKP